MRSERREPVLAFRDRCPMLIGEVRYRAEERTLAFSVEMDTCAQYLLRKYLKVLS